MTTVRVKAPATTANMGPGYDCLGMALDVWNTLEVEVLDGGEPVVDITGEGAGELGTGRDNLVYRSMAFLFDDAGEEMPGQRHQTSMPYNDRPDCRDPFPVHPRLHQLSLIHSSRRRRIEQYN